MLYKFLRSLLVIGVALFAIHYFLVEKFFPGQFFFPVWKIYAFLGIATLVTFLLVQVVHKHFPDKSGFAFMALSIVKMAAAIVFFLPLLDVQGHDLAGDVLSFFIPYFLFLLLEVIYVVRLINSR
jgi:hypothetical protein